MLDPQENRTQLFDALRPPDGYQLDRAVGTTFSLDLLALLTIPLAFTFWSDIDETGRLGQDPLALLHGVRKVADRLCVFCQAGQISVPRTAQRLFTYLEDTVFEVAPPHQEGVFHPKLWLLRYVHQDETDKSQPVKYRLLCLTRNLTFDQSWDTMLVLDGEFQAQRKVAYSRNHPLGDFIAALPGLAVRPLTDVARETVAQLSDEVRRVDFASPWGRSTYEFLPMGLNGRHSWPFPDRARRQLIISPFLTPNFLKEIDKLSDQTILISRLDSIMAIPQNIIQAMQSVYVLDPDAEPEIEEEEAEDTTAAHQNLSPRSGLHAKLFLFEYGRSNVELFTGSANATSAAFHQNVEFLVKFNGMGAEMGIDRLLVRDKKGDKEVRLLDLLKEYQPETAVDVTDDEQEQLEQLATNWQRQLARRSLTARVSDPRQPTDSKEAIYDVVLQSDNADSLSPPHNVTITGWPITRRAEDAVSIALNQKQLGVISGLSYAALTSFFAFAITVRAGEHSFTRRFVLNLPLENAPTDRREQTLRFLLDNRSKIMSYLLFLLAENDRTIAEMSQLFRLQVSAGDNSSSISLPVDLFESMVRALDRNPSKLDQIYSLVQDLERAGQVELLPDGFDDIWQPIWEARQLLRQQSREELETT